jgi:hypothetical protein
MVRPRASGGVIPVVAAEPEPATLLERAVETMPSERRYEGPLQLDLGRILLVHRVENIPPPPDFIFTPFVSSRRRDLTPSEVSARDVGTSISDVAPSEVPLSEAVVAALAANPSAGGVCAALVPVPIDPRPCRTVDEREACRRVERGWRVDVAPCLNVGASAEAFRARVRRRGISTSRALPASPLPSSVLPASPIELEAVSA